MANLGGSASFNLAFGGGEEKYASILEDDNWWEPTFLEEMITLMESKPDLDVAWSNMKIWEEGSHRSWIDTGRTVWSEQSDQSFSWPQPEQALGALHSNGAMIYKNINTPDYIIPPETLLDCIELVRERTFKHPIYLHSKTLANFSITLLTNRSAPSWKWTVFQVMLLSSMVMATDKKEEEFTRLLDHYRKGNRGVISNFFLANLFYIKDFTFYRSFSVKEWCGFTSWMVKNSLKLFEIKKYLKSQVRVYRFLLTHTKKRYAESTEK